VTQCVGQKELFVAIRRSGRPDAALPESSLILQSADFAGLSATLTIVGALGYPENLSEKVSLRRLTLTISGARLWRVRWMVLLDGAASRRRRSGCTSVFLYDLFRTANLAHDGSKTAALDGRLLRALDWLTTRLLLWLPPQARTASGQRPLAWPASSRGAPLSDSLLV
jgi:hypothetical protein